MRVLIVDDERRVADTLVMILEREGYEAACAYSGAAALQKIGSFTRDCVISDVLMSGMNGIELCATIEKLHPDCHILLFSGQASTNLLVEKAKTQGHRWELLAKPVDPDELLERLSSLHAPSVSAAALTPLQPGWRNEFHAGIEQAFGKFLVASGEYITKYTHNAYDFSVLGNTPIFFPIGWQRSKIPAFAGRVSVPNFHGFSALVVMSSVSARFFTPQVSGAGATPSAPVGVFRIDHDEKFNQTTHVQYQPKKNAPWFGFNWRYDSGMVAGAVPFATDTTTPVDLSGLSADEQFQAGLFCGNQRATLTSPLTTCAPALYGSTLISIPKPGTENDDKNPPRIAPRQIFDLSIGDDNVFGGDKYKWSLQLTAINLTDQYALYNFLSTFSGTHYVTPRAFTAQVGFHF